MARPRGHRQQAHPGGEPLAGRQPGPGPTGRAPRALKGGAPDWRGPLRAHPGLGPALAQAWARASHSSSIIKFARVNRINI